MHTSFFTACTLAQDKNKDVSMSSFSEGTRTQVPCSTRYILENNPSDPNASRSHFLVFPLLRRFPRAPKLFYSRAGKPDRWNRQRDNSLPDPWGDASQYTKYEQDVSRVSWLHIQPSGNLRRTRWCKRVQRASLLWYKWYILNFTGRHHCTCSPLFAPSLIFLPKILPGCLLQLLPKAT